MTSLSDQAARSHAVESHGSVLVQAPAGSGKTTLLTQRYLRLLTRVDAPERILALTFTRRAAEEMRERVIAALHAGRRAAEDPAQPAAPHAGADTLRAAVEAHRHLAALGVDLEAHPSRLRIETIDAFNAWLAGRLPIAAGAGAGLEVLADARPLYEEAARRTLAHAPDDGFGAAVHALLALDDQRWRKLVDVIAKMLAGRDRWLPLLAGRLNLAAALDAERLSVVRRQLDEDLALLILRVMERARETFGAERLEALSTLMRIAAAGAPARGELEPWRTQASTLRPSLADAARWRALGALLLTSAGGVRRSLTVREGFPVGHADKAAMVELLREIEGLPRVTQLLRELRLLPDPAYGEEQWARVSTVAQVMVLAAAELVEVFRERGAADFAAVSMAARRALGSPESPTDLALRLDYRLQHVLVDEFQDTSSAQLDLVEMLTAGWQPDDGRSLFCVGDPMQSIYGFRQAEVRAFLELAEDGIGSVALAVDRLTDNFRSTPALVAWVNATFAAVLPGADDRERGAIAFRPSVARAAAVAGDEAAVLIRGFATRAEEAAGIADLLAAAGAQPGERTAILVRARTHAREIASALRSRGVAFRAVDIEPLQDRAVVRDVIALAAALLHLGDRAAWLAVLRAPWCGLELADLLQLGRGAQLIAEAMDDDAVLAGLSESGRGRVLKTRAVLDAAFARRGDTPLARWVERTWLALGGPAVAGSAEDLALADAAFARLAELEARGLPDASEWSDAFADLYADHGADGAVEIMTIHKAKGLEFDRVIVPSLDRQVPATRDRLLEIHEFSRAGRSGLAMAARPGVGADKDRLFEFLRLQIRDAAHLEAQRLLYVACTRAKRQLCLTAKIGRNEDDAAELEGDIDAAPPSWSPRAGSLLSVLWPVTAAQFERLGERDPAAAAAGNGEAAPPRGGALRRAPPHWTAPPVAEAAAAPVLASPQLREETPVFDWVSETARRVGLLVHAELHQWPEGRDAAAIRARAPHFRQWLASHGVPEPHLDAATSRVSDALSAMLDHERGRWILRRFAEDSRELALSAASGPDARGIVRVIFDRSFVDEQGTRWVIDYKTSQHTGSGVEEFLDHEVERYRAQLTRYARIARQLGPQPVRVGLYFPLMRAWREWAP